MKSDCQVGVRAHLGFFIISSSPYINCSVHREKGEGNCRDGLVLVSSQYPSQFSHRSPAERRVDNVIRSGKPMTYDEESCSI